jgi:putative methylase
VRRSELIRRLAAVPEFPHPRADLEQVLSPPEAAAELLFAAEQLDGLSGRSVVDLGAGTGRLSVGAAVLGADPVVAVEVDPAAAEVARTAAAAANVDVEVVVADVAAYDRPADVVVMNPPFGAQRKYADRPFWDRSVTLARRSVFAFASADSRTFIARRVVARGAHIVETRPIPWEFARTFPHHTRRRVSLAVDLWALTTSTP